MDKSAIGKNVAKKIESKMKKLRVLTVVFGIAILIAGTLFVKANIFGLPHQKGGWLGMRALIYHDLSVSQKAEVGAIVGKYREKGKEINEQPLVAKETSKEAIEAEPFYMELLKQKSPNFQEGHKLRY